MVLLPLVGIDIDIGSGSGSVAVVMVLVCIGSEGCLGVGEGDRGECCSRRRQIYPMMRYEWVMADDGW